MSTNIRICKNDYHFVQQDIAAPAKRATLRNQSQIISSLSERICLTGEKNWSHTWDTYDDDI
jgi:hypothetical protein